MKKYIFLFLGITILTACTSFQQQKFDWRGQNFDDFITQYGVPTSQHTLQNGNIAYSFIKPCQYTQGQEEAMVAVDSNNIITSVSKISSCPSAQQDKQYKEYVDPQVNYLKEKNAKREQEILEQTQDRIYKVEHELFELNYDHSYELAVNSAENNLKATEGNYAQWKKHYEEKHKKDTDILKSHGIKQDSTITNMINRDNEDLEQHRLQVENAKKELEQAKENLKDWENRRSKLKMELEELNKTKDKYAQPEDPLEKLIEKIF